MVDNKECDYIVYRRFVTQYLGDVSQEYRHNGGQCAKETEAAGMPVEDEEKVDREREANLVMMQQPSVSRSASIRHERVRRKDAMKDHLTHRHALELGKFGLDYSIRMIWARREEKGASE